MHNKKYINQFLLSFTIILKLKLKFILHGLSIIIYALIVINKL